MKQIATLVCSLLLITTLRIYNKNCTSILIPPPPILVAPSSHPLTMKQAIKIALTHRHSQRGYDLLIKAAKNNERSKISEYLPQISLESRVGKVNRTFLLPERSAFLEAKQLLLSFAGPIMQYRIARQETCITIDRKHLEQDAIRFETEKSLLELWDKQEKYNFIRSLDKSKTNIFNKNIHENRLGLSDKNIWLTNVAKWSTSTADVEQYSDELQTALIAVERSLAIPISHEINISHSTVEKYIKKGTYAISEYDTDFYYQQALQNRKELLTLDDLIIREHYIANSFARQYIPEIYLFGQINFFKFKPNERLQTGSETGRGLNRFIDMRIGLEFDWKFDGLGNLFNSESALDSQAAFEASRIDTAHQIKKDVETSYNTLAQSLKQLTAQKKSFKQADNEILLKRKEYELGLISKVEMTEAEKNWQKAHYDLVTVKKDTAINYRDLIYKSGYPEKIT